MREQLAISIGHPGKVVAAIEQRGEVDDFVVFMKELPAGERRSEQPDAVRGRDLDFLPARAGGRIVEVIEPAVDGEDLAIGVAAQAAANQVLGLLARNPLAIHTDAECGEREAGNAGRAAHIVLLLRAVGGITMDKVFADAGLWIDCINEILKAAAGEIVEQRIVIMMPGEARSLARPRTPAWLRWQP